MKTRHRRVDDAVRLEALEKELLRLREHARGAAVVVEGLRDVAALERLGIGGTHLTVHQGRPMQHTVDAIAHAADAASWHQVIILVDWDRTGGRLARQLADGLAGLAPVDVDTRRRLSRLLHSTCWEDVPAELAALRRAQARP